MYIYILDLYDYNKFMFDSISNLFIQQNFDVDWFINLSM